MLAISCADGNKNQGEADVDCSGPCTTKCAVNQTCVTNADCANSNCHVSAGKCEKLSCSDGNQNQNETDIDCGGVCGSTCKVNQTCSRNTDCANGNCHTALKTCQPLSCSDGNKNQNETDVDCGGVCTTKCTINQVCKLNTDCTNGNCYQSNHTCQPYSCTDGNKNQGESDVDCGGPCTTKCAVNQTCVTNADCVNSNCHVSAGKCEKLSCSDGNQNQNETDIDCGGVCGSTCKVNQTCSRNTDCVNGNCHTTLKTCQ
ncbi:unnamed protein product, partial [Adineta ricciae]